MTQNKQNRDFSATTTSAVHLSGGSGASAGVGTGPRTVVLPDGMILAIQYNPFQWSVVGYKK